MRSVFGLTVLVGGLLLLGCGQQEKPTTKPQVEPRAQESQPEKQPAGQADTSQGNPVVVMDTSLGEVTVELFKDKAPITVENFMTYVKDGFYDGTVFHRVISNFMIQGGGFTPDMQKKPTRGPIKNEAANGLGNERGTIAMARTQDPHSATAQFFINVKDNPNLNHQGASSFGYCVFGKVIDGMGVVDKIRVVKTTTKGRYKDVPVDSVVIKSIKAK